MNEEKEFTVADEMLLRMRLKTLRERMRSGLPMIWALFCIGIIMAVLNLCLAFHPDAWTGWRILNVSAACAIAYMSTDLLHVILKTRRLLAESAYLDR
jgi:hypothetical protein